MAKIRPPSLQPWRPPVEVATTDGRPSTWNHAIEWSPRMSSATTGSTFHRSRTVPWRRMSRTMCWAAASFTPMDWR
eukprot:15531582-Heterocapsa_arctica.AAC.1